MKNTPLKRKTPMARSSVPMKRSPMKASTKPMAAVGKRAKRMRQGKVKPTPTEAAWMDAAQSFGCIVCWLQHGVKTPAAIHHILSSGRRMGHFYTLPLCDPGHHQQSPTPLKISRHPDKARFERAYGTEIWLLAKLRELLFLAGVKLKDLPQLSHCKSGNQECSDVAQ